MFLSSVGLHSDIFLITMNFYEGVFLFSLNLFICKYAVIGRLSEPCGRNGIEPYLLSVSELIKLEKCFSSLFINEINHNFLFLWCLHFAL